MKKFLLIPLVIVIIGATVFVLRAPEREEGQIGDADIKVINSEEFFFRNKDKVDEDLYRSLSEHLYIGEVNHRPLLFAFVSPDNHSTPIYSRYECSVYDLSRDEEENLSTATRYEVVINDNEMSLEYIIGNEESSYSCKYNGDLTVNGVEMTKVSKSEYMAYAYEKG